MKFHYEVLECRVGREKRICLAASRGVRLRGDWSSLRNDCQPRGVFIGEPGVAREVSAMWSVTALGYAVCGDSVPAVLQALRMAKRRFLFRLPSAPVKFLAETPLIKCPGNCSMIEHSASGRRSPPVVTSVTSVKSRNFFEAPVWIKKDPNARTKNSKK